MKSLLKLDEDPISFWLYVFIMIYGYILETWLIVFNLEKYVKSLQ